MKKTEKFRYFALGVIVTLILSVTVVPSLAAATQQTINVAYSNIKILIDGVQITPTDAAGKTVEPFIYNGTTYLPVRAVGEAFGKSVSWDGNTNSVYIGQNPSTDMPSAWLDEMEYFNYQKSGENMYNSMETEKWDKANDKDILGHTYEHGIKFNVNGTWENNFLFLEYYLNGKYSNFKGTLSNCYESRTSKGKVVYIIYGDDKVLYETEPMGSETLPLEFNINTRGVLKLKIEIRPELDGENWKVALLNGRLYE